MKFIQHFERSIILGSAFLGSGYGAFAAVTGDANVSISGIAVSMIVSAALCGCGASALCRYFQVWHEYHQ